MEASSTNPNKWQGPKYWLKLNWNKFHLSLKITVHQSLKYIINFWIKVNKSSTTHHNRNQDMLYVGKGIRILSAVHCHRQFQLLENFVLICYSKTDNQKQTVTKITSQKAKDSKYNSLARWKKYLSWFHISWLQGKWIFHVIITSLILHILTRAYYSSSYIF